MLRWSIEPFYSKRIPRLRWFIDGIGESACRRREQQRILEVLKHMHHTYKMFTSACSTVWVWCETGRTHTHTPDDCNEQSIENKIRIHSVGATLEHQEWFFDGWSCACVLMGVRRRCKWQMTPQNPDVLNFWRFFSSHWVNLTFYVQFSIRKTKFAHISYVIVVFIWTNFFFFHFTLKKHQNPEMSWPVNITDLFQCGGWRVVHIRLHFSSWFYSYVLNLDSPVLLLSC